MTPSPCQTSCVDGTGPLPFELPGRHFQSLSGALRAKPFYGYCAIEVPRIIIITIIIIVVVVVIVSRITMMMMMMMIMPRIIIIIIIIITMWDAPEVTGYEEPLLVTPSKMTVNVLQDDVIERANFHFCKLTTI